MTTLYPTDKPTRNVPPPTGDSPVVLTPTLPLTTTTLFSTVVTTSLISSSTSPLTRTSSSRVSITSSHSSTTTLLRASPTARVGAAKTSQGTPDLALVALLIIPIVFMFWIWVPYLLPIHDYLCFASNYVNTYADVCFSPF